MVGISPNQARRKQSRTVRLGRCAKMLAFIVDLINEDDTLAARKLDGYNVELQNRAFAVLTRPDCTDFLAIPSIKGSLYRDRKKNSGLC